MLIIILNMNTLVETFDSKIYIKINFLENIKLNFLNRYNNVKNDNFGNLQFLNEKNMESVKFFFFFSILFIKRKQTKNHAVGMSFFIPFIFF